MPETPPEEDTEGESEVDDTAEIPLPPPRLPKARGVVGTIASMGTHYEKKKVKLEFWGLMPALAVSLAVFAVC